MLDKIDLSKYKKWALTILLTVLLSFAIEIYTMFIDMFLTDKETLEYIQLPLTFHWVWEILALVGIFLIAKKFKADGWIFSGAIIIGAIICLLIWRYIPESINILNPNYYGIASRTTSDHHREGGGDEGSVIVYDYPLQMGYLYSAQDPQLLTDIKVEMEFNEFVQKREYLFWQTGLASGFYPYNIKEYNGGDTFFEHIELFFTVGPIVLVELFIKGMYSNFLILLLIQVVLFLYFKDHFLLEEKKELKIDVNRLFR